MIDLGEIRQRSGKRVQAFAIAGEFDPATVRSNLIEIEWPPRSGTRLQIPEVDRAEWFDLDGMRRAINPAQAELIDRLVRCRNGPTSELKRRGRDSNPRWRFTPQTHLAGGRLQPLGHLSNATQDIGSKPEVHKR